MSGSRSGSGDPQAIVHKRILDIAESNPDASLEGIAGEVSGATVELVDRVLQEYGDPSEDAGGARGSGDPADGSGDHGTTGEATSDTDAESREGTDPDATDGSESEVPPDLSGLSDKAIEALRLIRGDPDATQRELAEELDVTAATVSRWLNDIPGFDWDRRESFALRALDGDGTGTTPLRDGNGNKAPGRENGTSVPSGDDRQASIEELRERIETLEGRLESRGVGSAGFDTDLLHKVIHACMGSDRITETEELRVLEELIEGGK